MISFSLGRSAKAALMIGPLWIVSALTAHAAYKVTDLGTLSGSSYSRASQVNNNGEVVGASTVGGSRVAFSYQNGVLTDLGGVFGQSSSAIGLNDNGDIVGYHEVTGTNRGVIYRNGVFTEVGTFGGDNSVIEAINNSGFAVGYAETSDSFNGFFTPHALIYDNGVATDLNTLLPANSNWELSYAMGINDAGQITGYGYHNGIQTAYVYDHGVLTDIGALVSDNIGLSYGEDINANGDVVGSAYKFDGNYHGFVYKNGALTDLASVPGYPQEQVASINDAGQIVGVANAPFFTGSHAFLFENGATQDLNTLIDGSSAWELFGATSINNHGQIVGYGAHNGETHAFLLDPESAVPEPSSLALFLIGGVTLFAFARKKSLAAS